MANSSPHHPPITSIPRNSIARVSIMDQGKSGGALGSDSILPVKVSSEMPVDQIIQVLIQHGCSDVTGQLDLDQCGKVPISGGGFADIYKGTMKNREPVAIKCPRLYLQRDRGGRKILKHVARELYTWSCLKHPNVLELLGLAQFQHHVAMVAPWMSNRTLLEYVNRNPNVNRHQLGLGISEGTAYLHQSDAIHGDIKGANVLISGEGVPKLTDFGCSLLKRGAICFTTTTGGASHSTRWAAPEVLAGETEQSKEADVYALGMTLLELVTGLVPFSRLRADVAVITAVVNNKRTPERPEVLISFGRYGADLLWEIMSDSWSYDPSSRPDSSTIRDRIMGVPSEPGLDPAPPLVVDRDSDSDSGSDSDSQQNPPQQPSCSVAIIQRLESMPIHDLETRLAQWRENLPVTEGHLRELVSALQFPWATPEVQALFARAKQLYGKKKFLCQKSQEILTHRHAQLHQKMQLGSATLEDSQMESSEHILAAEGPVLRSDSSIEASEPSENVGPMLQKKPHIIDQDLEHNLNKINYFVIGYNIYSYDVDLRFYRLDRLYNPTPLNIISPPPGYGFMIGEVLFQLDEHTELFRESDGQWISEKTYEILADACAVAAPRSNACEPLNTSARVERLQMGSAAKTQRKVEDKHDPRLYISSTVTRSGAAKDASSPNNETDFADFEPPPFSSDPDAVNQDVIDNWIVELQERRITFGSRKLPDLVCPLFRCIDRRPFRRLKELKEHLYAHHNITPFTCEICNEMATPYEFRFNVHKKECLARALL